MANPQKENGYTPIANELLEAFLLYRFPPNTEAPRLLWFWVARKTYGYSKKQDAISLTQFEKGTKLPRNTIVHWLDYLVKALLLVKGVQLGKKGYVYAINKDYNTWIPLVKALKLVKGRLFTSKSPLTNTSYSPLTHKNKKQITKTIKQSKDCVQFNNNTSIKALMNNTKDIRMPIIGMLIQKKNIVFKNKDTYQSFIKRNLRSSNLLKSYSLEKIEKVMDYLIELEKDKKSFLKKWTLETVAKYIDEEIPEKTLEDIAKEMVVDCKAKYGEDKGANIAMFRFTKKYFPKKNDQRMIKYFHIFEF